VLEPRAPIEPPVDLSALHPARDPARLDRMRAAVLAGVAPALEARRAMPPRAFLLPPLLPAYLVAATILVAALASLGAQRRARGGGHDTAAAVAGALGLPRGVAAWVLTGEPPSSSQLARDVSAMEAGRGR
jgi:hypothetical protein